VVIVSFLSAVILGMKTKDAKPTIELIFRKTPGRLVSSFHAVLPLRGPESRRHQYANQYKKMEEKQLDNGIGDTLVALEAVRDF